MEEMVEKIKVLAGEDVVDIYKTDRFEKDNKISNTVRIIYQNPNKTLTDDIVNTRVQPIYDYLKENNYEIR
ncbi:MAG: hypothetical protein QM532_02295 [Cyanobium sp. MAG06]|nr:hypothetical protein [Cyanobium sp. MAG06]